MEARGQSDERHKYAQKHTKIDRQKRSIQCFIFVGLQVLAGSPILLDYTPKSTTNYSKLLTLLIRVGGVFRHLAITSSWLEPVLFDIILTSSSSLQNFVVTDGTGSYCNRGLHSLLTSRSGLRSVFWTLL